MTDVTKHVNLENHNPVTGLPTPHTPAWYANFGDKCPVCGAPAAFKVEKKRG